MTYIAQRVHHQWLSVPSQQPDSCLRKASLTDIPITIHGVPKEIDFLNTNPNKIILQNIH